MRTNNAPLSHHRHRAGITARRGTCPVIHLRRAHPALHAGQKTRTHEGLKVLPGTGASSVAFLMKQEATT